MSRLSNFILSVGLPKYIHCTLFPSVLYQLIFNVSFPFHTQVFGLPFTWSYVNTFYKISDSVQKYLQLQWPSPTTGMNGVAVAMKWHGFRPNQILLPQEAGRNGVPHHDQTQPPGGGSGEVLYRWQYEINSAPDLRLVHSSPWPQLYNDWRLQQPRLEWHLRRW